LGVRAWVGVTDGDWYRYLSERGATEVNFWQPSGGRKFGKIEQGAPFLFKSHYRDGNRIVGGGFFSGWAALPMSRAWEFFGPDNGCASMDEMRARIAKYSRSAELDPEVGCVMLHDVRFFPADEQPEAPPGWSRNIVQGKSYDLATAAGSYVEQVFAALLAEYRQVPSDGGGPRIVEGPVFGMPALRAVRVGQNAFKALVQEAYGRRCAVTGTKIVPVLEAAHIRPVTSSGENRVDNGLLLRSDVHKLFDDGYLGVHPSTRVLMVSPRLRSEYGNGEEFYAKAKARETVTIPKRRIDQPSSEFLEWHADEVFLAS
jgi:putative restriction endonuclease